MDGGAVVEWDLMDRLYPRRAKVRRWEIVPGSRERNGSTGTRQVEAPIPRTAHPGLER